MTLRSRLAENALPQPLHTLDFEYVNPEYEGFILEPTVDEVPFSHWTDHLRSFWGWYAQEPDYSISDNDLPKLKRMISDGLKRAGFVRFSEEIDGCGTGNEVCNSVIRQYTEETPLYSTVNSLLRGAHAGQVIREHPLSPWMLQLNTALRQRPTIDQTVFRGANMPKADIDEYNIGRMFHWASFVSVSRDRDKAIFRDTNVVFEIEPWGAVSMYGKRNSYDIAALSEFPDEEEGIFPFACTFRVHKMEEAQGMTTISLHSVDCY